MLGTTGDPEGKQAMHLEPRYKNPFEAPEKPRRLKSVEYVFAKNK